MRNEADGMLGAVIASESLGLTDTMINGAGGCRSRTQIMMHSLIPKYYPENRGCCKSKYFSRQSRLPCTYLNNDDIVFGSSLKVSEGIESVSAVTGKRTVMLDTLGASLICTDYSGLTGSFETDPIFIEGDLSSMTFSEGYDLVTRAILSSLDIESGNDDSVNILGYGLMDLGWETGADNLCSLLEMMGIKVNCILGCIPDSECISMIGSARLNILIHPEYSINTANMLKERFGTPYLRPTMGAPIGYPAIRSFIEEVAAALGKDPSPALDSVNKDAERVHQVLMNYDRAPMSLHAKGLVLEGDSSTVYPLLRWMTDTFGMAPKRVLITDDEYRDEINSHLKSMGFEDAAEGIEGEVEIMFTDGMCALEGRLQPGTTAYIETRIPWGRMMDLMGRTLIGTQGCRYLLDEIFNSIIRFRCGQPTEIEFRPE